MKYPQVLHQYNWHVSGRWHPLKNGMGNQIKMMAEFADNIRFSSLPAAITKQLKIHLLDSLASFIFSTRENFPLIPRCCLKTYNAEVHTQSAIAAAVSLREQHRINPEDIRHVNVTTFLTAYHIVGGGEYGNRTGEGSRIAGPLHDGLS
jgi:2-methylcitrate dehydratase PrpD